MNLRDMVYEELVGLGPGWHRREDIATHVAVRSDIRPEWLDQSACCLSQRIQAGLMQSALNGLMNQGRVESTAGINFRAV